MTSAQAAGVWKPADFVIEDGTVYGFTDVGLAKLSAQGGRVELPTTDSQGTKLTKVGSFAFTPNKRQAIEEYTGRPGVNGVIDDLDVDGEKIHAVGANFGSSVLKEVVVPDGYLKIGQDAFAFNKSLASVKLGASIRYISDYALAHTAITTIELPKQLVRLADQVFFDNQITGELVVPAKVESLGEGSFKSNKIENIRFEGSTIRELPERVFEDNALTTLHIPTSIVKIHPAAFNGNPGSPEYGGFVVLLTGQNNPNSIPDGQHFYVDPVDAKKTIPPNVNVNIWDEADFTYDGATVTGFSHIGEYKVRQNKNLEIPASHGGIEITKIGADAFRNVDQSTGTLRKYDLETVTLPDSIAEIGDFAFQSNKLTEFLPNANASLKKIGAGAFMNNNIEMLLLPTELQHIGDAAFHINRVNFALIPRGVTYLGRSAFRQNTLELGLGFEVGAKLTEIGEMAFAESSLSTADLSNATLLKSIGIQAFAGNQLSEVTFPGALEGIGSEAFRSNQLVAVSIPRTVTEITFNAFDDNPGNPDTESKVTVRLPDDVTKTSLSDGDNFVIVGASLQLADKTKIVRKVAELKAVDQSQLRADTKVTIQSLIKEGDRLIANPRLAQGKANSFIFSADFFLTRMPLDEALNLAQSALETATRDNNNSNDPPKLLQEKFDYVAKHFNNAAWDDQHLARAEHEIQLLSDLVLRRGAMAQAVMKQGVYELESPLPIPSYFIGVNVYFNPDGSILYVLDRSYSIGEGQVDDYGNPISNVDEDNEGYHQLALATLADYEGKYAKDIVDSDVDSIGGIRQVAQASYHRAGIYLAIRDAAKDFLRDLAPSPAPSASPTPSETSVIPSPDKQAKKPTKLAQTGAQPGTLFVLSLLLTAAGAVALRSSIRTRRLHR